MSWWPSWWALRSLVHSRAFSRVFVSPPREKSCDSDGRPMDPLPPNLRRSLDPPGTHRQIAVSPSSPYLRFGMWIHRGHVSWLCFHRVIEVTAVILGSRRHRSCARLCPFISARQASIDRCSGRKRRVIRSSGRQEPRLMSSLSRQQLIFVWFCGHQLVHEPHKYSPVYHSLVK